MSEKVTSKKKKSTKIALTKKELENVMVGVASEAVKAEAKRLGLDKIDRKFAMYPGAYAGISNEDLEKMDKKERAARFVKAVFHKDINTLVSMKALAEGTGATGGFQVPEEFAAEINRIAEDVGIVRRFARRIPMGSDTLNVPRLASSVSVTYPGENTAGTESEPVWESVQLLAKTAVGLTVSSNELLADANVDVVNLLAELFAEALASSEDAQGLVGTGAPFTGILNDTGVSVVTMGAGDTAFTNIDADDLRDLITQVKATVLSGAAFTMHREIWGTVQKLKDVDGNYIASTATPVLTPASAAQGAGGAQAVGTIWGYPVWLSDQMPDLAASAVSTKFVIFGNYGHLWLGDRQSMTMSVSDAASVGANNTFEQNQSALRITERIAIAVGLPKAFAVLETAAV